MLRSKIEFGQGGGASISIVRKKKHPLNISDEAYLAGKKVSEDKQMTLYDFVNESVLSSVNREQFVKMYAPYISEEHVTENVVFLNDTKLNKIAVVRLREFPDTDLENSGYYGYCETCDSDCCIHVRTSLASGSLSRLKLSDKKALKQKE